MARRHAEASVPHLRHPLWGLEACGEAGLCLCTVARQQKRQAHSDTSSTRTRVRCLWISRLCGHGTAGRAAWALRLARSLASTRICKRVCKRTTGSTASQGLSEPLGFPLRRGQFEAASPANRCFSGCLALRATQESNLALRFWRLRQEPGNTGPNEICKPRRKRPTHRVASRTGWHHTAHARRDTPPGAVRATVTPSGSRVVVCCAQTVADSRTSHRLAS